MASLPSPSPRSVESQLAALYERRALLEQVISHLEKYADMSDAPSARKPVAQVVLLPERIAR